MRKTDDKPTNPIQMAVIGAAHGIKGEVKLKSFTGDPAAIGDYGPLFAEDGRRFTIETLRPAGSSIVAKFKEVRDRTAAETLSGTALHVDRAALPDDLDEEEFYQADLIGLGVVDLEGAAIGKVQAVHDFGAGDILDIRKALGGSVMVPFTKAAVPAVDIVAGTLTVDPVAAGLVDDGKEDEA
jgi:16S rRNA processing protein RimM